VGQCALQRKRDEILGIYGTFPKLCKNGKQLNLSGKQCHSHLGPWKAGQEMQQKSPLKTKEDEAF
jgi:hypothetical protein